MGHPRRGLRFVPTTGIVSITGVALVVMLLLAAAGCGGDSTTSSVSVSTPTPDGQTTTTAPVSQPVPPELADKALHLVGLMEAGSFEAVVQSFDDTMKNALPAADLETAWTSLKKQVGEYQQPASMRLETSDGYRAVIVQADFAQAKIDIRIVFDDQARVAGLFYQPAQVAYTPPSYVQTDEFTESELTVESGRYRLPGTLALPNGDGPFPAVVLVHGSGPNDRDETIGPNKPFRDLAQGLASAGIAVLRYDKRTLVYPDSAADPAFTANQETVEDAVAAFELLRTTSGIDPERVYILGHSLGGMMLPRIGQRAPGAAGLIYLAAPARPSEDIMLEQVIYLLSLEPNPSEEEKAALEELKTQVQRVKDPSLSVDTPAEQLPLGISASYWLDLRGYDPPALAQSLPQAMLVAQGGRDYQVTNEDFERWRQGLAGGSQVVFALYPDLNHLFQAGEGKSRPSEYLVEIHVAEEVVADIAEFILGPAGGAS